MNLPPDKVRLLRSYDNEKKWELICDQVGHNYATCTGTTKPLSFTYTLCKCVVLCCAGALPGEEPSSHLHPEAERLP